MSPDSVFLACTALAALGWVALLASPGAPRVQTLSGLHLPCVLSAVYVVGLAWHARELSGGFGSLEAVAQLFSHRWALLAGWIHYLTFDLFVGSWIAADACRRHIARLALTPVLLLTFLLGPAGLLSYLALRKPLTRP
jgi:hypothetical protein